MAKARVNKNRMGPTGAELPECPVCFETMSAPIYLCQTGHSLCSVCTQNLCPAICPICRQPMTQMRSLTLEEVIAKAVVPCPNKPSGCVYTLKTQEIDDHLKECLFRDMNCPLGIVFGKCSWNGKIKDLLQHFNDRHPGNCNINTDSDIELDNISINEDDRRVFLVAQEKKLFILTFKIDTIQKMSYWLLQHIGSKKVAQQFVYEIHITSKQDNKRQVTFHEYCFNDALQAEEICRHGKCGIVPLSMLNHFIKAKTVTFKFLIKRIPVNPTHKFAKGDGGNSSQPVNKGPKGSRPQGPRPQGPRPKSPGPINIQHNRSTSSGPQGHIKYNKNHPFNYK